MNGRSPAVPRKRCRAACDILVVGAGPAGSAAALAAAQAGARVVMVDRRRVIGVPVQCAEYIPAMLLRDVPACSPAVVQSVRAMRTFVPATSRRRSTRPGVHDPTAIASTRSWPAPPQTRARG